MGSWVSKLGQWFPKQEYFVNQKAKPGENPVYQGPDRGAMEYLNEQGVESIGTPYNADGELVMRARQLGFKDVDEYLKVAVPGGFDKKAQLEKSEKEQQKLEVHETPERKNPTKFVGGGRDYANQGKDRFGGIGSLPNDVPASFVKE